MAIIVIVKNNTGSSVFIEDMGIAVPGSGQRDFSEIFDFTEICASEDLLGFVTDSTFTINDGTNDLNINDAQIHLDCKNAGGSGSGASYLNDLLDVNIPVTPGDKFTLVYDESLGLWNPGERDVDVESTEPPVDNSSIWMPADQEGIYVYNEQVGDWVSSSSNIYTFSRDNKSDGAYLGIANHDGYYYMHDKGYITSIHCHSEKGNMSKSFQIHINGSTVHNFSLVSGNYNNHNLSIQVNRGDILRTWVMPAGGNVQETTCQLVIYWSHEEVEE